MMLEIRDLYKKYDRFPALNGLNMKIEQGEFFGFVGPNGAGKTTTIKIVAGLLSYDSGSVKVAGIDVGENVRKIKERIGYMPDFFGVYDNLKTIEYMEFYASIYGMEGRKARKRCLELMDMVNLADKAECYVDGLSRGMKQKLCLARSLVHNPDLLILDEPASGLDPRARLEMKEILKSINSQGKTIIISSHILPELVEMCSSIGIIDHGAMVAKGDVNKIMDTMNASRPLVIQIVEGQKPAIRILKKNPLVSNISIRENQVFLTFNGKEPDQGMLLKELIEQDVVISSFKREENNLETLFLQLTDREEV